ncbi:nuclear transcription factor Y subunit B-3-like [Dendrobium catenatum]|uniref:nuclear transcription factor Y subunit B-3-like n=1 Tax=Dendrobium catenatum TaxID=906689 RepID=UPI0009F70469|nr:nuclear transcription factor Y subunit B-3-like [Dendrobium catenatum]
MNPCINNHIGGGVGGGGSGGAGNQCTVREQDRFMPIANVIRIMRKVLPTHAKISDDAKETIQECVSEYISFITSEANERCQREQRKTITAEDVLWAMSKLGFDDYVEPLSVHLQRYREHEGDHRGSIRGEPIQLKRAAAEGGVDNSPAVGVYGLPQLQAAYHFPATEPHHHHHHQHQHHHFGVYGGAATGGEMGGYYMGVYGDPETGSSQELVDNFDLYAHYK